MSQLQLDLRSNPDALALKQGGRVWYTAYPIREDLPIDDGEFYMHKIVLDGDPEPSREGSTKVVKELNRTSSAGWAKKIRKALTKDGPMSWPALVATIADTDVNTAERTKLEAALWDAIKEGKVEHDAQFMLRAVTKNAKRKPVSSAPKSSTPSARKRPSKKARGRSSKGAATKRPSRSYRRPSAERTAEAACVLAAKKWGKSVRRTCGADAPSKGSAGRVMAERKWTSPGGVARDWKAGAPWAANPAAARYWANPDGLRHMSDPTLSLEDFPMILEELQGAFRTDQGAELFVWGEAPYNAMVYLPRTYELFHLEGYPEEHFDFDTVMEALGASMRVAAEAEHASWHPGYYASFEEAIGAFTKKPRNRLEFARLFSWNDANGAYDNVLMMEPDDVVELFNEIFADNSVPSPRVETYQQIKTRLLRE